MKRNLLAIAVLATFCTLPAIVSAQGGAPNAPFAGAAKMTCAEALKQAPKDSPKLASFEKEYRAAEAKLKKAPKDAKAKKAAVEAAYKYGMQITHKDDVLTPGVKYRAALALFRHALQLDPKHAKSQSEKAQIEEIYKGMGRDVPK